MEEILAIPAEEAILASAKAGIGIEEILEAIVARIPSPPLSARPGRSIVRALVFDSVFDIYRGVVSYVRMFSGRVEAGTPVKLLSTGNTVRRQGSRRFHRRRCARSEPLETGDVGYIIANIKSTAEIKIGDTLTDPRFPAKEPLPGFQEIHPMVFSGIYPINTADFEQLKTALGKLQLNDAAFVFQPESSRGAGLRLPLRVPRAAAHGDHPGAAAARVRHGHHRHVPERHLRGASRPTANVWKSITRRTCPTRA